MVLFPEHVRLEYWWLPREHSFYHKALVGKILTYLQMIPAVLSWVAHNMSFWDINDIAKAKVCRSFAENTNLFWNPCSRVHDYAPGPESELAEALSILQDVRHIHTTETKHLPQKKILDLSKDLERIGYVFIKLEIPVWDVSILLLAPVQITHSEW